MSGRFEVIRYPRYYAVTDMQKHVIVFESRNRLEAHRAARKLNKRLDDRRQHEQKNEV